MDLSLSFNDKQGLFSAQFSAMNSPCQIIIETVDDAEVKRIAKLVKNEAKRIETKYSRFNQDSVVGKINLGVTDYPLDSETLHLIEFAKQCYELSDGLFDITAGKLRQIWNFKTLKTLPTQEEVSALIPFIGLSKIKLENGLLSVPKGMELDLGGIGKEYAVDRCWSLAKSLTESPFLINFGGDLRASGPRKNDMPWKTLIEDSSTGQSVKELLTLKTGALATSGDTKQFFQVANKRYSHILNPRTGWPVNNPPSSITVAAPTCLLAGLHATLAMLHGEEAVAYLSSQDIDFWIKT